MVAAMMLFIGVSLTFANRLKHRRVLIVLVDCRCAMQLEHVPPKLNRWGSMGFTGRSG